MSHQFFATCPKNTADLLAAELAALGAIDCKERVGGVAFHGALEVAYRACLWSRIANRVLLVLARFPAPDADSLYAGVGTLDWAAHVSPTGTLAIDAVTGRSQLTHSHFIAQRAKDAVVDQLRDALGNRPSVDTDRPDIRLNLYLDQDQAQLALDLAGESLHRRGYRTRQGAAPIKENLAAAILYRAGWPKIARGGGSLVDPMCGSGTFLIEAAMIAGDIAPGLLRNTLGSARWRGHDAGLWQQLLAEAEARRAAGRSAIPPIVGYDSDPSVIHTAWENIDRVELRGHVHVERHAIEGASPPHDANQPGLVVCNPPYGERLGAVEELVDLYRTLGARLREFFVGWEAIVLTANPDLGNALGIKAHRSHTLFNGALECRLLRFRLTPEFFNPDLPPGSARVARAQQRVAKRTETAPGAAMFANRLTKNLRAHSRWARRENITCYRLYDADMPEYSLAIDLYHSGDARWVHVQEYAAPASVDEARARARLDEALAVMPEVLEVSTAQIIFKRRQRQRGTAQYERLAEARNFLEVMEGELKFRVNLRDYLDTGLFFDHRVTRSLIRERSSGVDVLNLFAYTGTASVYAAAGGARSTTSVDMSATYCQWARQNLALNGFGLPTHQVVHAECLSWLDREPDSAYDLIFLDPPTFSNSKRMEGTLDVQRDHVHLIEQSLRWLAPTGTLVFSTNLRRFRLDTVALSALNLRDVSRETLPADFKRNTRIHQCFEITRRR